MSVLVVVVVEVPVVVSSWIAMARNAFSPIHFSATKVCVLMAAVVAAAAAEATAAVDIPATLLPSLVAALPPTSGNMDGAGLWRDDRLVRTLSMSRDPPGSRIGVTES